MDGLPYPPFCSTTLGALYRADAIEWMGRLPEGRCRLIVADPPYNRGKATWDRLGTTTAYVAWTRAWLEKARRLLTPDGTLYLCGMPETLALVAAEVRPMFHSARFLVWYYRNKASLGEDWGRSHEGLLHLRAGRRMIFNTDDVRIAYNGHTLRYPIRSQARTSHFENRRSTRARAAGWRPHPLGARPRDVIEVPALSNGSAEKTPHPTQKPVELIRRLVLASSLPGDLVIDPFGGAGTTYAVCEATGRRWLGCEREARYCRWIAARLAEPSRFIARNAGETDFERASRRARLRGRP